MVTVGFALMVTVGFALMVTVGFTLMVTVGFTVRLARTCKFNLFFYLLTSFWGGGWGGFRFICFFIFIFILFYCEG